MISGRIVNRQAVVPVTYRLPGQPDLTLEHVLDTGFTADLTLPPEAVAAMRLPFAYLERIKLANDSKEQTSVHMARILLHGVEVSVRVLATGKRPLYGTALMAGKELVIQFVDNGLVTIDDC